MACIGICAMLWTIFSTLLRLTFLPLLRLIAPDEFRLRVTSLVSAVLRRVPTDTPPVLTIQTAVPYTPPNCHSCGKKSSKGYVARNDNKWLCKKCRTLEHWLIVIAKCSIFDSNSPNFNPDLRMRKSDYALSSTCTTFERSDSYNKYKKRMAKRALRENLIDVVSRIVCDYL